MSKGHDWEAGLCEVVTETWSRLVGLRIQADKYPETAAANEVIVARAPLRGTWTGCLQISADMILARLAAIAMLSRNDVSKSAVADCKLAADVIGELSNIMAGCLLRDLPGPTWLGGPPTITTSDDYELSVPGAELACSFPLACRSGFLITGLYNQVAANGA